MQTHSQKRYNEALGSAAPEGGDKLPPDFLLEPKVKDATDIAIEAIERELDKHDSLPKDVSTLGDILDIAKERLALPSDVHKFTDNVTRNFVRTANSLRNRAGILRQTAAFLDERAQKLDEAAPYLTKEIEDWIAFERESAAKEQSLSLVKP